MAIRPQQTTPGTSSTSKRLHIRWTRLKITILVMALVVLIAAGGVGWWLFSPLFFHNTAKDANPFASSAPPAGATAAGGSTPVTSTTVVTGKSGPVILAQRTAMALLTITAPAMSPLAGPPMGSTSFTLT